jgi:steroid 5-alpha reductase family enzyme
MLPDALLVNAGILIAMVLVLWLISVRINDVSFIDAFWGSGMALMAVISWLQAKPMVGALGTLILIMTAAWGFRLGIYLLRRWRREGEDPRYARILKKDREADRFAWAALTKIWLGQAVLLFLVSSPAQVGILASDPGSPIPPVAWAGFALYLVGIVFEWTGDWQLARFKADPAKQGQILDTGLWRYTRHPNYFGDCCAWWGIWLCCAGAGWTFALYTLPGPLFLTFTLTRWSGAALLEAGMKKKRGDKYATYIARTSAFLPWPPKQA